MKTFTINDKSYCYDFSQLNCEQVEAAITIGEYRLDQKESEPPESIDKLLRSRASEYIAILSSYIFVPCVNDQPQPFQLARIHETEKFFKEIQGDQFKEIVGCINDFFLDTGMKHLRSTVSYSESKKDGMQALLKILPTILKTSDSSRNNPDGKDAGIPES